MIYFIHNLPPQQYLLYSNYGLILLFIYQKLIDEKSNYINAVSKYLQLELTVDITKNKKW